LQLAKSSNVNKQRKLESVERNKEEEEEEKEIDLWI